MVIDNLRAGFLKIVPSSMKFGKNSVRGLNGGDPRDVFSQFEEGETVVVIEMEEFKSILRRVENESS